MPATTGIHFRSLNNKEANELRARLNRIAAGLGYLSAGGRTQGQGSLARLLLAIDSGEVVCERVQDAKNGKSLE